MRRRVLLAFQGTSYRPDAYVAAARDEQIELVLATDVPAAARRFGLPLHAVDLLRISDAVAALSAGLGAPLDGVIAADEPSAMLAAALAAASCCRVRHHTLAGVESARDKRLMRARLALAGVPVPDHRLLPAGEPPAALGDVRYPCVVKPPMLSGSQGVIRADDAAALAAAVARCRSILQRHPSELRAFPGFYELLVEDYVDGPEVAVEGLMAGGALELFALFDKPAPLTGPFFEESMLVTPSRCSDALQSRMVDAAERAAKALGLCDGPVHVELRLSARRRHEPVVIELAGRSIGGLCSRALAPRIGSLEARLLRAAAGLPSTPLPTSPPACGVLMIPVPGDGVLRAVHGLDRARAVEHVTAVVVSIAAGEPVRRLPEGRSYLGFIFASAPGACEVEQALGEAHRCLHFELKKTLPVR